MCQDFKNRVETCKEEFYYSYINFSKFRAVCVLCIHVLNDVMLMIYDDLNMLLYLFGCFLVGSFTRIQK